MQKDLDDDRASFRQLCDWLRKSGCPYPEAKIFLPAAESLIGLDEHRRRPLGWGLSTPELWSEFERLRDREQSLRETARSSLDKLVKHAHADGVLHNSHSQAEYLGVALLRFDRIPARERELYRARREWGRKILKNAKRVFYIGASNQIVDLSKSGGQSMELVDKYIHTRMYEKGNPPNGTIEIGRKAALAQHFGAGNCGDQNRWVATEAYRSMPGTKVTVAGDDTGHIYTIIGPPNFPEAAYLDAWPTDPTVADVREYGLKHTPGTYEIFSRVADGRDLRAEGLAWLHQLPDKPPRKPPIAFEDAVKYAQQHSKDEPDFVKYITKTKDGYNSDSEPEGGVSRGRILSREAFTGNAYNNFLIQDPMQMSRGPHAPAMSRIAATRPHDARTGAPPTHTPPARPGAPSINADRTRGGSRGRT
ncbi:hypothetical protein [Streptomyces flaveolus]|uniref:hypothetical protein n=1 Tax=Streptomyces flaveolus TaxID=67297 RepID=UPI0033D281C1